jgi:extracellular elastinolytic metalloproteinase
MNTNYTYQLRSMNKVLLLSFLLFGFTASFSQDSKSIILADINAKINKQGYSPSIIINSDVPLSHGGRVYYGQQVLNGLPIFNTEFYAVIIDDVVTSANYNIAVDAENRLKSSEFVITPNDALYRVAKLDFIVPILPMKIGEGQFEIRDIQLSDEPVKITQMWIISGADILPIYEVSMYEKNHKHWYNTRIDATTGKILNRNDWVTQCAIPSPATKRNDNIGPIESAAHLKHKKTSNASYQVFAFPTESPNHGNRTIVLNPQDDDASPFGWHDDNGVDGAEYTITRGNNVYASDDKDDDNIPGASPSGGSTLTFTAPYDKRQSAVNYLDASTINLFYSNNIMHDVWWHYGFDEASGNFQTNNYGNGGVGNDALNADAQDGSGTNNANMSTPPDGFNPRMQMYIWNSSPGGDYFQINSPHTAKGKYLANKAGFGPALTTSPIVGNLVLVNDGGAEPEKGCNSLTNSSDVSGNIALIERRTCNFTVKVKNAQDAGAVAVVIYSDDENPIQMGGSDNSITIPSVLITLSAGNAIKAALRSASVNVSLYDSSNLAASVFDSDFDNGIIAHEYGHGISNRLTGGPASSSCLSNEEQMGEGWSDFFALVMTHEPGDQASDVRGIGTYVTNEPITGGGIRPYPYSGNINASPYKYNDIKRFSVPHGVGSVWCSMLWDLYWAMIDKHGYDSNMYTGTGGNNMAMQLVIDGLKLQPCNPGFVDGRNAIILADKLNNDGANQLLIWEVFARRGLGVDALQGSTDNIGDGDEDYKIPPYLLYSLVIEKTAVPVSVNDQDLRYDISVANLTTSVVANITIIDTLDTNVELVESSISCDYTLTGTVLSMKLDSISAGDSFKCSYTVIPKFLSVSKLLVEDNIENGEGDWRTQNQLGTNGWKIVSTNPLSGTNSWFVANAEESSDYYLEHSYDLSGVIVPIFSFNHYINSEETWDGGVVEVREEGGNWIDAGSLFTQNGYTKQIQENPQSAISGRASFTGNSSRYVESIIDLSNYADKVVEVRFRFATDGAQGGAGWFIDDVKLVDAVLLVNKVTASYGIDGQNSTLVTTRIEGESIVNSSSKLVLSGFTVYPNPTQDRVFIRTQEDEPFRYRLCTITGKELLEGESESSTYLSVRDLTSGVYLLTIEKNGKQATFKVIKN